MAIDLMKPTCIDSHIWYYVEGAHVSLVIEKGALTFGTNVITIPIRALRSRILAMANLRRGNRPGKGGDVIVELEFLGQEIYGSSSCVEDAITELHKFMVRQAVAAERERCATIAGARVEEWDNIPGQHWCSGTAKRLVAQDIAAAIRRPPTEVPNDRT